MTIAQKLSKKEEQLKKQEKCLHKSIRTARRDLTRFQCRDCDKWFSNKNVPDERYRIDTPAPKQAPRVLLFDLETAPLQAYLWGMWNQNVNALSQLITPYWIITWSAKWLGDSHVMSDAVSPKEARKQNDYRIVKKLWDLFNEADIIIAHNGIGFDIPHSNARFLFHGLDSPSPYKAIDTLKVARKQFKLPSNRLDYLAKILNIEMKHETTMELWVNCMNGKQESLDYMLKYNENDVFILEAIYLKLRSWIKGHPNYNVYVEENDLCPTCGAKDTLEPNGIYPAVVERYQSYKCSACRSFGHKGKSTKKGKGSFRSVSR